MRLDALALVTGVPGGTATAWWVRNPLVAGLSFLLCLAGCAGIGKGDLNPSTDDSQARKRAMLYLELASTYFAEGKNAFALDAVKQSLAADNTLYEAHNLGGLIYMRMNQPVLAEDGFRKALLVQPQAASVQHNYGWLLCQQGRLREAIALFGAALTNTGYDAPAKTWMTQGVCQAKAGQAAQAEHSLRMASQLEPTNPVVSFNLALHLFRQSDFARAQSVIAPVNASAWANAETLWLGIRLARQLGDEAQVAALGAKLRHQFGQSREVSLLDQEVFND